VARRTRYSEYKDRYANYRFELSEEGILLMQCHTKGGSLVWDWKAHDEMSDAFADVAGDREIKVLIHTGTGESYNADLGNPAGVEAHVRRDGRPAGGSRSSTRRPGTAATSSRTCSRSTCR